MAVWFGMWTIDSREVTSQVRAGSYLATAARVTYPAAWQRILFDAPLLAAGLLTLKEDENKISQTDFELWNDGGSISSSSWKVTWYDGYVEVILSEEEQVDEQVILQFDGKKEFQQLFDEE